MKNMLILMTLLFALPSLATVRDDFNQLLKDKGTSLETFEGQGARIILGETTGGGRSLQFKQVQVIFTRQEAILQHEIESADLRSGNTLGNLESLRSGGKYILNTDIIGVIAK